MFLPERGYKIASAGSQFDLELAKKFIEFKKI